MNCETVEAYTLGALGAAQGAYNYYVRPSLTAKKGWGILGLGILAYELACPIGETLSEGVDRALEKHPLVTSIAIGAVALHLLNMLPEKVDPLHVGLKLLKNRKS